MNTAVERKMVPPKQKATCVVVGNKIHDLTVMRLPPEMRRASSWRIFHQAMGDTA
jgi:hypothetical protein